MGPGQVDSKIYKTQTPTDALDSLPDLPKAGKSNPVNIDKYSDPFDSLPTQQNKADGLKQVSKPFCDSCKQAAEISNDKVLAATIQKAQIQNKKIQQENTPANTNKNLPTQNSTQQNIVEKSAPAKQIQYAPDKIKVAIREINPKGVNATNSIKHVSTIQNNGALLITHPNIPATKSLGSPQTTNIKQGVHFQTPRLQMTQASSQQEFIPTKNEPMPQSKNTNQQPVPEKSANPLTATPLNQIRFSNFNQMIQTRTTFKESFIFATTQNNPVSPAPTPTKGLAEPSQMTSTLKSVDINKAPAQTMPLPNKIQIPANGPSSTSIIPIIKTDMLQTNLLNRHQNMAGKVQNTRPAENVINNKINPAGFTGKILEGISKIPGIQLIARPLQLALNGVQFFLGGLLALPSRIFSSLITGLSNILGALLSKWKKRKRVNRKKESQADCDSGNQSDTTPSLAIYG